MIETIDTTEIIELILMIELSNWSGWSNYQIDPNDPTGWNDWLIDGMSTTPNKLLFDRRPRNDQNDRNDRTTVPIDRHFVSNDTHYLRIGICSMKEHSKETHRRISCCVCVWVRSITQCIPIVRLINSEIYTPYILLFFLSILALISLFICLFCFRFVFVWIFCRFRASSRWLVATVSTRI